MGLFDELRAEEQRFLGGPPKPPMPPAPPKPPGPTAVTAAQFALALIEHFESFRARPYQDQNGVWTIGFGTTRMAGYKVLPSTPAITIQQARDYLLADMQSSISTVASLITVPLSNWQSAALISFEYNEGCGHLAVSTLRKQINAKTPGADSHFLDWDMIGPNVSGGLLARRKLEQSVYRGLMTYAMFIAAFPLAV